MSQHRIRLGIVSCRTDFGKSKLRDSGRRAFIGGSDARIIMGNDEAALVRLWQEKRGEVEPEGPLRQSPRPARPGY